MQDAEARAQAAMLVEAIEDSILEAAPAAQKAATSVRKQNITGPDA